MKCATIIFSDGTRLLLRDGDRLIPISFPVPPGSDGRGPYPSMSAPVDLVVHFHNGLIPSIFSVLLSCDFFYLNDNQNIVYGTHTVVRIVTD